MPIAFPCLPPKRVFSRLSVLLACRSKDEVQKDRAALCVTKIQDAHKVLGCSTTVASRRPVPIQLLFLLLSLRSLKSGAMSQRIARPLSKALNI